MKNTSLSTLLKTGVTGLAAAAIALGTTGCETNAGSGALVGAAVGAGIGAIAGDDGGGVWKGALAGAAVGAATGAIIKAKKAKNAQGDPRDYPVASFTNKNGIVRSPYAPNGEVDVRGFEPGELAIDPTSGKIFRVP